MRALRRVLLPIFCAVLVLTPSFRAAGPLPAELSDVEFWQLSANSSEEGGGFFSENFVSNELGYPYVMPELIQRTPPGGAYLGVGPEQNFTYVAATRPRIAFIIDIRRQNMIEHLLYKAVFELSANRTEFLSRLFARKPSLSTGRSATPEELFAAFESVPQDAVFYQESLDAVRNLLIKKHRFALSPEDETMLEHVYEEFAKQGGDIRYSVTVLPFTRGLVRDLPTINGPVPDNPNQLTATVAVMLGSQFPTYAEVITAKDPQGKNWSFLATEDSYQTLRGMQQKNLIIPLVGDFAGPKAIRAVGQYLKDHDATLSTFYVSNVEQYLTPVSKLRSFYDSVATLPFNSSSTFIRSAQIQGVQPGLAQSSIGSIQTALDAVLEGRALTWNDILRLPGAVVKLVVFDLDGTLTRTNDVDAECFVRAFMETLQLAELNQDWDSYEQVSDEGVTRQIFVERFGRHPALDETQRIIDRFLDLLDASHGADASAFVEIPGAVGLLRRIRQGPDWAIALATGAWRRSAEFKIQRAALPVTDLPSAFAEDGPSREAIVQTAIERARKQYRQEKFERITSVGDALWDVKTARNLGLSFLGIASGARALVLRDNGASHVIEDYRDPDRCLQYLNEAQAP